jgi:hypothetical protein
VAPFCVHDTNAFQHVYTFLKKRPTSTPDHLAPRASYRPPFATTAANAPLNDSTYLLTVSVSRGRCSFRARKRLSPRFFLRQPLNESFHFFRGRSEERAEPHEKWEAFILTFDSKKMRSKPNRSKNTVENGSNTHDDYTF